MVKRIQQLKQDIRILEEVINGKKPLKDIYSRWSIRTELTPEELLAKLQEMHSGYDRWNEEMPDDTPEESTKTRT